MDRRHFLVSVGAATIAASTPAIATIRGEPTRIFWKGPALSQEQNAVVDTWCNALIAEKKASVICAESQVFRKIVKLENPTFIVEPAGRRVWDWRRGHTPVDGPLISIYENGIFVAQSGLTYSVSDPDALKVRVPQICYRDETRLRVALTKDHVSLDTDRMDAVFRIRSPSA